MSKICNHIVGFSIDGRFRKEILRNYQQGKTSYTNEEITKLARSVLDARRCRNFLNVLEEADLVCYENFHFVRENDSWKAAKHINWDEDEEISRYAPLAARSGSPTLSLNDETEQRRLWDLWQDEITDNIQKEPGWQNNFSLGDFPLERYDAEKARCVCGELAAHFGPTPACSAELIFWFVTLVEQL